MTAPLRLTLPLPPISNHLYAIVNGHKVKSREARDYEGRVGEIVQDLGLTPSAIPLPPYELEVRLFLRHDRDVDGVKALLDSISTALGFNDKVIQKLVVEKFRDPRNPRCEVVLAEVQDAARQEVLAW